jgi:hypothetical protein
LDDVPKPNILQCKHIDFISQANIDNKKKNRGRNYMCKLGVKRSLGAGQEPA